MEKKTIEELILETMPFPKELIRWCKINPKFFDALKVIHSKKFLHLGAFEAFHSPYNPNDLVMKIYSYAYKQETPLFKQDFIVNKGELNKEFLLFTRYQSSKWVKDINEFNKTYGNGGHNIKSHHLTFEELPETLKPRGIEVQNIADKINKFGLRQRSQEEKDAYYEEVKALKKGTWFTKIKLR